MEDSLKDIIPHFSGRFVSDPELIREKLLGVKAYIFDWDGVFNNGLKDPSGTSLFNEVDAMGTNLLRFSHYLRTGELPVVFVISGEMNQAASKLAAREHFNGVYSGFKYKPEALDHLAAAYNIKASEVAFFFDDVLDLSLAALAGVRIMVGRAANPLMTDYVVKNRLADYITACDGNNHGLREGIELLMGIGGHFTDAVEERMNFTEVYTTYLARRNEAIPKYFITKHKKITEQTIP
ncbi:MAG: phosphatase [Sphingobacteriales bacterium]|nr:MAG: phosphatase [Sphingobacteriales bacterium]